MRAFITLLCFGAAAWAGAPEDWEKIVALDAGPGVAPQTVEQARAISLGHTGKQEAALRAFLAAYPRDANAFEARLRLARVVALRADLRNEAPPMEAGDLLAAAAAAATTPAQRAEVDFTRLAQRMRQTRMKRPTPEERKALLDGARAFQRDYPEDRRLGALLAEIATLFDGDAKTKERLLEDAKRLTKDPQVLAQIADDLKRLGFIGRPFPLRFTAVGGARVDVKDFRGKPVAVVFFASWSPPSRAVIGEVMRAAEANGAGFIGVSLDTESAALNNFLVKEKIKGPIAWDGKSWQSPLVQLVGINSLPAVWLLDKQGAVSTLDPLDDVDGALKQLQRAP